MTRVNFRLTAAQSPTWGIRRAAETWYSSLSSCYRTKRMINGGPIWYPKFSYQQQELLATADSLLVIFSRSS